MLIPDKKSFVLGLVMAVSFLLVFAFLFTPSFDGKDAFKASDDLFNSIAKGSTYYIPRLKQDAENYRGTPIQASLRLEGEKEDAKTILSFHGVPVSDSGDRLEVSADLGNMLLWVLEDSDALFHNRGEEVSSRYGMNEREALYNWWRIANAVERALQNQSQFEAAAFVAEVRARGIEVGYNFYEVEPERASTKAGILTFSLVFYVLYTLWWGYAIFYLAQGLGLQLKGGAKKEV
jgi:hypothetical protein